MTAEAGNITTDRARLDALRLHLGTQLATHRRAAGISQPELATALGKTRSMVSKVEHGQRGMPAEQWRLADDLCHAQGALVAGHTELMQADQEYRDHCQAQRRALRQAAAQTELDALQACPAPHRHQVSGPHQLGGPAARPHLALFSGELAEELMQVVRRLVKALPRREAMQVASWALAAVGLTGLDTDEHTRVAQAMAAPHRVDEQVIENLATTLASCKRLQDKLGAAEVVDTVVALHNVVHHLLAGGCPERLRRPLLVVDSKMAAAIGMYMIDMGNHGAAQRYFQQARIAGHDARSATCAAYAAANMSWSAFLRGETHTALDASAAARSLAAGTDDAQLKALAEQRAAGAYALNGQYGPCQAAYARAQKLLADGDIPVPHSLAYWVHDGTLGSGLTVFLSALGRPKQAVEAAHNALARYDRFYVHQYAECTVRLGNALVLCEEIDEAARVLADAASVASQSPSRRLLGEIRDARAHLQPWQATQAVKTLDAQLQACGLAPRQGQVT